jgi:hypothetical protein
LFPALVLLGALTAACGGKKEQAPGTTGAASAPLSAAVPDGPPSPFSVVLVSPGALAFSALEGGVWISDESRAHVASAAGDADLALKPMPPGLPASNGRILGVSGKLPRMVWLSVEKLKDDGKPESTPLFHLLKDEWKLVSEDWKPEISSWSKNRILSASTSSGKLKIKVIEPAPPHPPADLPSPHLTDESCEKTLRLTRLTALSTGEVFATGTCKAGSPASSPHAVAIRWGGPPASPGSSASAAPSPAPAASSASALASASPASSAGQEAEPSGPPGVVDLLPGASRHATSRGLVARSATLAYTAFTDQRAGATLSHLLRFDGSAWVADTLPATGESVRGLAVAADGTLWLLTEHTIWKRASGGAFEAVPPPGRAFPEPGQTWDFSAISIVGDSDVWIAAHHVSATSKRDAILRLKAPKGMLTL